MTAVFLFGMRAVEGGVEGAGDALFVGGVGAAAHRTDDHVPFLAGEQLDLFALGTAVDIRVKTLLQQGAAHGVGPDGQLQLGAAMGADMFHNSCGHKKDFLSSRRPYHGLSAKRG